MIRFSLVLFCVIVCLLSYIFILQNKHEKHHVTLTKSHVSDEFNSVSPANPSRGSLSSGESLLKPSESIKKTGASDSRLTKQDSNEIFTSTASVTQNFSQTKSNITVNASTGSLAYPFPTSTQISQPTGAVGGGTLEIQIPVPEGAKVPVVFFDAGDKPVAQQKALDRIAREFEKNVAEIPVGLTKQEVWEAARATADERFIKLYGYQAYSQYHIQAAKEALKEKRANSKGP